MTVQVKRAPDSRHQRMLHEHDILRTSRLRLRPWVVEAPGVADFLGYVGLVTATFQAHFTP